jgi:hypothetical protein
MGRPFKVNIDMREIDKAIKQVSQYDQQSQQRIGDTIETSTSNIKMGVLQRMPIRTGAMAKKLTSTFDRSKLSGTVAIKSPLAHLIEFGAKGVTEYPKDKKAMTVDEFGLRRYASKVVIPAREAHPMMRPAYEDEQPNLMSNIKGAVEP